MALCAAGAGAAAARGQCRRGRARHLQGPLFPRNRPAPLSRRDADRRLGGRGRGRLHLPARRIPAMPCDPGERDRRGRGGRARAAHEDPPAARRRRLYLRRGIGDARKHRGQARAAAAQAAVSLAGRPVRPADPDQQCRDAVLGARHRREGAGMVHRPGPQRPPGAAHLLGVGAGQGAGRQARPGRDHRARADRRILRRHGGRPRLQGLSAGRRLGRHPAGGHGRHPARFRHARSRRLLYRLGRGRRAVRPGRHEGRWRSTCCASSRTRAAASARRAGSAPRRRSS